MPQVLDAFAVDFLIFTEEVELAPKFLSLTDYLILSEDYESGQLNYSLIDTLSVQDACEVNQVLARGLVDSLSLTEYSNPHSNARALIDYFSFVEYFVNEQKYREFHETLVLTEVFSAYTTFTLEDTLVLTESFDLSYSAHLVFEETLTLSEGHSYESLTGWIAPPVYNATTGMNIVFTNGITTLTLRNYDFGNTTLIDFTRVNRRTRGGDVVIGRASFNTETFEFTLGLVNESDANDVLSFLQATIGQEIEFHDHEGTVWQGIVLTPNAQKRQTGKSTFTIALQFEANVV